MNSTLGISKIAPTKLTPAIVGPGADAINAAYAEFCESTTLKAIRIGQMLREQRSALAPLRHDVATGKFAAKDNGFIQWIEANLTINPRTAQRWMELAEVTLGCAFDGWLGSQEIRDGALEVDAEVITFSAILNAKDENKLPEAAREARQLLLEFVADKTMNQCIEGVVTEGDPVSRLKRAYNGKTKGGTRGENRKDYPAFIKRSLKSVDTHLSHDLAPDQQALVNVDFATLLANSPEWLLVALSPALKAIMKERGL